MALTDTNLDRETLTQDFYNEIEKVVTANQETLAVIPQFADQYFLAWDDDSGEGYDAAFEFTVPANGDYHLWIYPVALALDSKIPR